MMWTFESQASKTENNLTCYFN